MSYPLKPLYEEVAFIAYHFHWSHDQIMNMEHRERKKWVEEISKINVSTISKRKSIILAKFGLVTNHRKILRNCLIIEGIIFIISYILSLMLASLFANLASLLLSGINLTTEALKDIIYQV